MRSFIYIILFLNLVSCKILDKSDFVGSYKTIQVYDVQDYLVLFPNNKFQYKWYAGLAGNGMTYGSWYIKKNNLYLTSNKQEEPIRVLITKQPQKPNFKIYQFILKDHNGVISSCSCVLKYKGKIIGSQVSDENGICEFQDIKFDEIHVSYAGKEDFDVKDDFEFGTYDVFLEDKKMYKEVFNSEKVKFNKERLKLKNKIFYKYKTSID